MNEFTHFYTGKYSIEYSWALIDIAYDGHYVRIVGKEPVTIFDVFTDCCENEAAIDKYFETAKQPNGE